jgi:hypothetical protein
MIESDRDHETVIEVLAAFVRERTSTGASDGPGWNAVHDDHGKDDLPRIATDVQAALTVIGRRPDRPERRALIDLSLADLCGANLTKLNLIGARLWRTKLRNAIMFGTRLDHANLCWAQLQDAILTDAQLPNAQLMRCRLENAMLTGANLHRADLQDAYLQEACLADADLTAANLKDAMLESADLTGHQFDQHLPARGLGADQLSRALITDTTHLPDYIRNQLASGGTAAAAQSSLDAAPQRQADSVTTDHVQRDRGAPAPSADQVQ